MNQILSRAGLLPFGAIESNCRFSWLPNSGDCIAPRNPNVSVDSPLGDEGREYCIHRGSGREHFPSSSIQLIGGASHDHPPVHMV